MNKGCGKCRWYRDCDWGAGDCRHPKNLVPRYNTHSGKFLLALHCASAINKDGACSKWERKRFSDFWLNRGSYAK